MLNIKLDAKLDTKALRNIIEDIVISEGCTISKIEWRSKYNSYVVYDYEPFCADGFNIAIDIDGSEEKLQFVEYLYKKRLKDIEKLKSMV